MKLSLSILVLTTTAWVANAQGVDFECGESNGDEFYQEAKDNTRDCGWLNNLWRTDPVRAITICSQTVSQPSDDDIIDLGPAKEVCFTICDTCSSETSSEPSSLPSSLPIAAPSRPPSPQPSPFPTSRPTLKPSQSPSRKPSQVPSMGPSLKPSQVPSDLPSL
eukprot:CAMPEP_0194099424 /NCGR_PEP_ID=MMETSP0150-20130528/605_1 /TAXON_ID=122233 /ORGANISM="Chaetoceros debilis, Strain MM31A-1" /LENGTH=162 /DNA_ID=CAMNT_0038785629 /DNA_START=71 /DNA_END=556 /DNA_ORIENTATION=-